MNLATWCGWGAIAAVVFALGRRFPLDRDRWVRSLAVHVPVSLAVTTAHLHDVERIAWAEADGNYVRLHTRDGVHPMRETLAALLEQLGGDRFIRIHRSRLVNLDRVAELRVAGGGDCDVVLVTGERLGLSRSFRDAAELRLRSGRPPAV